MNQSMSGPDSPDKQPRRTTCEQRIALAKSIINHRLPVDDHTALVLLLALDGWTLAEIAEWEAAA